MSNVSVSVDVRLPRAVNALACEPTGLPFEPGGSPCDRRVLLREPGLMARELMLLTMRDKLLARDVRVLARKPKCWPFEPPRLVRAVTWFDFVRYFFTARG